MHKIGVFISNICFFLSKVFEIPQIFYKQDNTLRTLIQIENAILGIYYKNHLTFVDLVNIYPKLSCSIFL